MRFFIFTFLACFLLACHKTKFLPDVVTSFELCNETPNDSLQIANKFQGNWILSSSSCYYINNPPAQPLGLGVKVSFFSNDSFRIKDSRGTYLVQGTWQVKNAGTNNCRLVLSDSSKYLSGRVLFCGYKVLFNDMNVSIQQGCNSTFIKCKTPDCSQTYK
jgi:hypothetical protein